MVEALTITKVLLFTYVLPGTVFYSFVVYVLFKGRKTKFKSTFFKFCTIVGASDCLRNIIYVVAYIFPRLSWFLWFFRGNRVFVTIAMVVFNYLLRLASVFYIVLAATRMTAMAYPLRHNAIWSHRFKSTTVLAFVLGGVSEWNFLYLFQNGCFYKLISPNTSDALAPLAYEVPAGAPLCGSSRMTLALVGMCGFALLYAQRTNLSVAIVCMVNNTAVKAMLPVTNTSVHATKHRCPARQHATDIDDGYFIWPKKTQGYILGAFFWGYIATQLIGGVIAERKSGKYVLLLGMAVASVCSLLTPIAAEASYMWLMVVRIVMGLGEGVVYPSMHSVWSHWAPVAERTVLIGFTYAGAQAGNVMALPVSGALCAATGWESIFYFFGGLSCIWCVLWFFLTADTPAQHKRISALERDYIETSLAGHINVGYRTKKIPWKSIATSGPVWAICVATTCAAYGTYLTLTELPTFMSEVLRFDIKSNGLYSMCPYIAFFVVINIVTVLTDYLRHINLMSTAKIRKFAVAIALIGQAAFFVGTGYVSCNQVGLAVVLLTCSAGISGFQYGGFLVNHADIAPRYAGTLMGISNSFGTASGIIAPYVSSAITTQQSLSEWRVVFWIAAGILVFGAVFYAVFADATIQSWALTPSKSGKFTITYLEQQDLEREPLLPQE